MTPYRIITKQNKKYIEVEKPDGNIVTFPIDPFNRDYQDFLENIDGYVLVED